MQISISPFASYSDRHLLEIKEHLERQIAIINGSYVSKNPKRKPIPFTHMKNAWTKSLELLNKELNFRNLK